jgi:hypothetical protein
MPYIDAVKVQLRFDRPIGCGVPLVNLQEVKQAAYNRSKGRIQKRSTDDSDSDSDSNSDGGGGKKKSKK